MHEIQVRVATSAWANGPRRTMPAASGSKPSNPLVRAEKIAPVKPAPARSRPVEVFFAVDAFARRAVDRFSANGAGFGLAEFIHDKCFYRPAAIGR
ncbi:MAG: hypothetical protein ACK2UK_18980 [Candidatus Promineifilaceae bacterium]